jgi:hypothetical protein
MSIYTIRKDLGLDFFTFLQERKWKDNDWKESGIKVGEFLRNVNVKES